MFTKNDFVNGAVRAFIITTIGLLTVFNHVEGHGALSDPPPRGALYKVALLPSANPFDYAAPFDSHLFFPAGSRGMNNAGHRSQIREGGQWTPFTPLKVGFKWRSGVCGDLKSNKEAHRRGGQFYYDAKIVRNYAEGSGIDFRTSIVGHHGGFLEFHICDVSKCGGDIGEHCFRGGACKQMKRDWVRECQVVKSSKCGPIDRKYPGRWYLPCPLKSNKGGVDTYGDKSTMRYLLPKGMVCDHCVIQWYWSVGNDCNPSGLAEYFQGPDQPKGWGGCEDGVRKDGRYRSNLPTCGGTKFSQEYFNCVDVRVVRRGVQKPNPFDLIQIGKIVNWKFVPIAQLMAATSIIRRNVGKNAKLTVRANLKWPAEEVEFIIKAAGQNGKSWVASKSKNGPFFMFGIDHRGRPHPWKNPILGKVLRFSAKADGHERGGWVQLDE